MRLCRISGYSGIAAITIPCVVSFFFLFFLHQCNALKNGNVKGLGEKGFGTNWFSVLYGERHKPVSGFLGSLGSKDFKENLFTTVGKGRGSRIMRHRSNNARRSDNSIKERVYAKKEKRDTTNQIDNRMSADEIEYDVAILGSGVSGHAAALNAMERNMKVLVFAGKESSVGGTCVNVGCIPSKSLLYATNKYRELKNLDKFYNYGIYSNLNAYKGKSERERNQLIADSFEINISMLKEYTDNVIKKLRGGIINGFRHARFQKGAKPVDVVFEEGEIVDRHVIKSKTSGKTYRAKNIIIAVGSSPNIPKNVEIDQKTVFTSDQAVKLEGFKEYMSIIGMGIIGLEFCDIYTALGAEVTFFEYAERILPMLDKDVASYFEKVFLKTKPVNYHFNTEVRYIRAAKNKEPVVIGYAPRKNCSNATNGENESSNSTNTSNKENSNKINTENEIKELYVDSCLVATGRKPNTENLGLEKMNIQMNRGFVSVDKFLRVKKQKACCDSSENNSSSCLENASNSISGTNDSGEDVYDNIFCIGDANGKQMLAHTGSHQALKVVDFIELKEKGDVENKIKKEQLEKGITYKNIPSVCYTNPEVAFVGLTEKEAAELYGSENIGADVSYYKSNSKILCENNDLTLHSNSKNNRYNKNKYNSVDNSSGMIKIVYHKTTKHILGMFIVGQYASILIHEGVLAINLRLSAHDLSYMVHSHPTVSEVLDTAFKSISEIRTH